MSGKIRQIRDRIKTLKTTSKITSAMQLVASAKLNSCRRQLKQAQMYSKEFQELSTQILELSQEMNLDTMTHAILHGNPAGKEILVVISPDRGLCGSLNSRIYKKIDHLLSTEQSSDIALFVIGKKAKEYIKAHHPNTNMFFSAKNHKDNFIDYIKSNLPKSISFLYPHFQSILNNDLNISKKFPIKDHATKTKEVVLPLVEPSKDAVIKNFAILYLLANLNECMAHSSTSENASRMIAMENATKNSKKLVDKSSVQLNKLRQLKVTNELLDIISGSQAV